MERRTSIENERKTSADTTKVIETINEMFEEAIVVTDVGQHQMFTTQYLELTEKKQLLTSGGLGTMGYGFPGAIGAQLGNPDTPVIAISGDGGMQMNIQEFATAVGQELPLILCVFNNNYLGMVRQWQKLFYGKRYSMTCLRARKSCEGKCGTPECECPPYTPDFVKLAESYGAKGIRVFKPEEIKEAFEEARKNTKTPTLIEFIMDPEDLVYPMIKAGRNIRRDVDGLLGGAKIMNTTMKKRWISLYVENQVGVLPKISGLFSGKIIQFSESLTVGTTEDPTISRMTIEISQ